MEQFLNDKRINNTWAIIPISELPDDMPVLVVTQMHSKSLAEFHLAEYVIVPKSLEGNRKPKAKKLKPKVNVDFPEYHKPVDEKRDTKRKPNRIIGVQASVATDVK